MTPRCPFCSRHATAKNEQQLPVCYQHKKAVLGEMKCACGEYLMMREGKSGVYFVCMNCGNLSANKVFEMNEVRDMKQQNTPAEEGEPVEFSKKPRKIHREEITITSDDPNYF